MRLVKQRLDLKRAIKKSLRYEDVQIRSIVIGTACIRLKNAIRFCYRFLLRWIRVNLDTRDIRENGSRNKTVDKKKVVEKCALFAKIKFSIQDTYW